MKFAAGIVITAILAALCLRILPWWCSGILACIVVFLLRLRPGSSFLAGFLGVALAWGGMAWWMDAQNAHLLSTRVGALFMGMAPVLVVLMTAFLGGLSGGLGGMTGGMLYLWTRKA